MSRAKSGAEWHASILKSVLIAMILATGSSMADDANPSYGFFPSTFGKDHKKFTHNIFGFSIDLPSNWVFGVNGKPPLAVVILYPEGVNQSTFSPEYETIEIGQLPPDASSFAQAQATIMKGMKNKHPNLTVTAEPKTSTINGRDALCWTFEWKSAKTGYTVIENVFLVQSPTDIRSITVRTSRGDYSKRMDFYRGIMNTFEPFTPK